ncbi:hypothetical protein [Brevundimonas bacteroides]|uniref:hypothetical protein n=1 Tax=Brevundimonas bacteroides TaxID=74311 RepID=UPI000494F6E8|nr:hypothetical protein [Brevundimonas bacteroides]
MTVPAVVDPAPWRRLAREARKAAEAPDQAAAALAKAEKAARLSVVIGVLSPSNPCVRLVRLSRAFVDGTVRKRRDLLPELLGMIGQVEALTSSAARTADPDPPERRVRADIDG